jgi:hypothetical protein
MISRENDLTDPFEYFCEHIKFHEIEVPPIKVIGGISVAAFLATENRKRRPSSRSGRRRGRDSGKHGDSTGGVMNVPRPHQIYIKRSVLAHHQMIDLDNSNLMDYVTEAEDGIETSD